MNQNNNIVEEHPEYFIALCAALMRRLGTEKVTITLAEMEEASAYGIGLHTHADMQKMDITLLTNPEAASRATSGLDYTFNAKPGKTQLN
jgi:hypothetical protein